MRRTLLLLVVAVAAAALGAAGGWWLAERGLLTAWLADEHQPPPAGPGGIPQPAPAAAPPGERVVLYYRDPTGKPDYSPTPKQDAQGRDYLPVYEDEEAPLASPSASPAPSPPPAPAQKERRVLYYRNPMGLPDTSPVPKKDSMGMDYIPVYADEAEDAGVVRVSPQRVQMLGVRTDEVVRRALTRAVRAAGTVAFDERRTFVVSTKFDGWIEKLLVNATGEQVRRCQPLMQVYSPDLLLAQQEYVAVRDALALAQDGSGGGAEITRRLLAGAVNRLRFLDFPADALAALEQGGPPQRTLTLRSPYSGTVVEKPAVEGMRFMPGEPLYRIVDLSQVWVIAEVFEQDLGLIAVGQPAEISVKAYPDRSFAGRVGFVYPTLRGETRTAEVRIEIANPGGLLKEQMYASVEIEAPVGRREVLAVPDSAVIDSGARQVVLVERSEGRFEPRPVTLGSRAEGWVEVREGLAAGERVVTSANFLIDSESNLRAALQAFTAPTAVKEAQP